MDEDLARVIRRVLSEAEAAGLDFNAQDGRATETVLRLRPDLNTNDVLNAINLVRWFL